VNGDGKPDVIVANECTTNVCPNGQVSVLLGNGDGTFKAAVSNNSGGYAATSVAVADVNDDGKPDLLVTTDCAANLNCGSTSPGVVGVLLGNGDGTFQPVVTYDSGGDGTTSVAAADVNGDGQLDLVVANVCGSTCSGTNDNVGVLLGNGDGTFQTAVTYGLVGIKAPLGNVILADMNGDGRPDALVSKTCTTGSLCTAEGVVEVLLGQAQKTTTKVATSGSPSLVGKLVTFTATITAPVGPVADGVTVTFMDGTTVIGTETTTGGVAKFSTSSLTAKTHAIKATYAGNLFFRSSSGSVQQVVNKYATNTALHSTPNPSNAGQTVTFTAKVTSAGPTPTGKVRFLDGTTVIGTETLSGGVATLNKSTLTVGTHSITAQYLGDAASAESKSSSVSQVVQ